MRIELELRIDVDGRRALNVVSGDFYSNLKRKRRYLSSFRFEGINTKKTVDEILITGTSGKFDPESSRFEGIQISIEINSNPLNATVQLFNNSGAQSKCICKKESSFFRRVYLEHHYEKDVVPFVSYNTNELPSPTPHKSRSLSIVEAYAEAGIELILVNESNKSIPHPKGIPGRGSIWTDNELDAVMSSNFCEVKDESAASIWLFSAYEYAIITTKGIRLSDERKRTQRCVVFQIATGWRSPEEKRMRLFIYVHELGHCLNLRHPWENAQSGFLNGYSALTWMNYPWRYHSSDKSRLSDDFWESFRFQFTDLELMHLRHAFRDDIIPPFDPSGKESLGVFQQ